MGRLSTLVVAAAAATAGGCVGGAAVRVTPPPCSGADPSACPYYWHTAKDGLYQVFINGQESFVYQAATPPKCQTGHINCARHCERQRILPYFSRTGTASPACAIVAPPLRWLIPLHRLQGTSRARATR